MAPKLFTLASLLFLGTAVLFAQKTPPKPYGLVPAERQLRWHEMEMYVLIHFTPTTFEDKEWGYGDADPKIFNPTAFDADQIAKSVQAGGFKGMILVSKHHDGFCLWPTQTTRYNISQSPFRRGQGDMVREFEQAARKQGLKFGVYVSPWDRNHPQYGTPEYVEVYRAQLRELYTQYGPLFTSWHDGANGGDGYYGGARETRKIDRGTYYEWNKTWAMTRQLQPNAVIFSDMGWDIRWVGNEKGYAAETSWATYTPAAGEGESKPAPGATKWWEAEEGHRNGQFWMPAECDVPLRKGWFYHKDQDQTVKTPSELFDLYFKSVGRGCNLDLGIAPDTRGLLHENDVASLRAFGEILHKTFSKNLTQEGRLSVSNTRGKQSKLFGGQNLLDEDRYSYWATDDPITTPHFTLTFKKPKSFNIIRLRENIRLGQRVEKFEVEAWQNGAWQKIATGTSIGANRLLRLPETIQTTQVRVRITQAPASIALSDFGLFLAAE